MLRTIVKSTLIFLLVGGALLAARFCVMLCLGLVNHPPGGEASVFQGAFIIADLLVAVWSLGPWLFLLGITSINADRYRMWPWVFELDWFVLGLVYGSLYAVISVVWRRLTISSIR